MADATTKQAEVLIEMSTADMAAQWGCTPRAVNGYVKKLREVGYACEPNGANPPKYDAKDVKRIDRVRKAIAYELPVLDAKGGFVKEGGKIVVAKNPDRIGWEAVRDKMIAERGGAPEPDPSPEVYHEEDTNEAEGAALAVAEQKGAAVRAQADQLVDQAVDTTYNYMRSRYEEKLAEKVGSNGLFNIDFLGPLGKLGNALKRDRGTVAK